MLRASKSPGKLENNDFYAFEQLANLRTIGALRTISGRRTISEPSFAMLFFLTKKKKQNEKNPHENEMKNCRSLGAPIVRGAKGDTNYAEYGYLS